MLMPMFMEVAVTMHQLLAPMRVLVYKIGAEQKIRIRKELFLFR
jgi:hypothetical protein